MTETQPTKNRVLRDYLLRDYGITILVAVLVALGIRFFLVEAYKIPGNAMKPALLPGDTLFVSKSDFGLRLPGAERPFTEGRLPRYGEVVVYVHPSDPPRDSIKRVAGLPGDRVEIRKGRVILNGKEISRSEKPDSNCGEEGLPGGKAYAVCWETPLPDDLPARVLGPDEILLVADLRSQNYEGRKQAPWAIVSRLALKGSARWIWLSIEPATGAGGSLFARLRLERMLKGVQ